MAMTAPVAAPPQSLILSVRMTPESRGEKSTPPAQGVIMTAPGLVRTVVPTTVGALLSFLATHGIQVDSTTENALAVGLTGVLGGAYWLVANALQSRWPLAGLLLGSTARPTYTGRHRKTSADPATATSDTSPEDRQ